MAVSKELLARYKELKAQGKNVTLSELKAQMEAEESSSTTVEAPKTGFAALSSSEPTQTEQSQSSFSSYGEPKQESSWTTSYYSQNENSMTETPVDSYSSSFESASNSLSQNSIEDYSSSSYSNDYSSSSDNSWNDNSYSSTSTSSYSSEESYNSTYQEEKPVQQSYQQPVENHSYYNEQPAQSYQQETSSFSSVQNQNVYSQQSAYGSQSEIYSQSSVVQNDNAYSGNVTSDSNIDKTNYVNNFKADFSWSSNDNNSHQINIDNSHYSGNLPPQQEAVSFMKPTVTSGQGNIKPLVASKFAVIGYPLGHSLSTYIHEAGFRSLGLDYTYEILETPPDELVDRIKQLKYRGYAGFNVTIPLKLPVTLFLDYIDESADVVGAVNTVVVNEDKSLKGYNTDVIGFRSAIPADVTLEGKTIGILGTGGAARAAITAFALERVKEIKLYTRNIPNCAELLGFLRSRFPYVTFNVYQIERIRDLSDVQILVNATPIGMSGRSSGMTPVEENELKTLPQGALVYDVIYNPKKTLFIKLAERNGYRTINGVDMFIHQAVAAEKIWLGRTPDFKDMKIAALENL